MGTEQKKTVAIDTHTPRWLDRRFMRVLVITFLVLPSIATIEVYWIQPNYEGLQWIHVDNSYSGYRIRPMEFTNPNENEIVYSGLSGLYFYDWWEDNITGPIAVDDNGWYSGAYDIEEWNWNLYMATGGENHSIFAYEKSYQTDEYEMNPFIIPNVTASARFEEIEFYYDHPFQYVFFGSPSIGVVRYTWATQDVLYINATNGLPSDNVHCLRVRGSTLLVGTGSGFAFFDLQTGENFTCTEDDEGEPLVVDYIDYHQVSHKIFAANDEGLFIFNENGNNAELARSRITNDDGLESRRVTSIEIDTSRKRLYIGTYGGLSYIDLDLDDDTIIPVISKDQLSYGGWPEDAYSILTTEESGWPYVYIATESGFIVKVPVEYNPNTPTFLMNIRLAMYGFGCVFLIGLWFWYSRAPQLPRIDTIREMTVEELIEEGESDYIEFKSSLRWRYIEKGTDKWSEEPVFKAIAGFLAATGGTLLIGVDDDGNILGLEDDYQDLKNWDVFQNQLTSSFNNKIGGGFRNLISVTKEVRDSKDICRVDINPSPEQVYVLIAGKKALAVRQGGRTQVLDTEESYRYITQRWPSK